MLLSLVLAAGLAAVLASRAQHVLSEAAPSSSLVAARVQERAPASNRDKAVGPILRRRTARQQPAQLRTRQRRQQPSVDDIFMSVSNNDQPRCGRHMTTHTKGIITDNGRRKIIAHIGCDADCDSSCDDSVGDTVSNDDESCDHDCDQDCNAACDESTCATPLDRSTAYTLTRHTHCTHDGR